MTITVCRCSMSVRDRAAWVNGHVKPSGVKGMCSPMMPARPLLALSHPDSPERTFVVVISHDCDLAADPGREPFVEVVTGRLIDAIKADSHAKSARRLQIEFHGPQGLLAAELSAAHKTLVKKDDLAAFDPRTDVRLDAQGHSILQRWLAARYRRAAFPDEFERRLKEARIPRRIEKALDAAGKHMVAVFSTSMAAMIVIATAQTTFIASASIFCTTPARASLMPKQLREAPLMSLKKPLRLHSKAKTMRGTISNSSTAM